MPEEESGKSIIDQGPRRTEPAHREVTADKSKSVGRRTFVQAAAAGLAGFFTGMRTGREAERQDGVSPLPEAAHTKQVAAKEVLGLMSDVKEEVLINTAHAQRIDRDSNVILEPNGEEPLFFYEPGFINNVAKMAGVPEKEMQSQTQDANPEQPVSVLSSTVPTAKEGTTMYQILLPQDSDNSLIWFNLKKNETCYVIGQGADPVQCELNLDTDKSWPDMGEGSVYSLKLKGRDTFAKGASVYVMIHSKKPDSGTV